MCSGVVVDRVVLRAPMEYEIYKPDLDRTLVPSQLFSTANQRPLLLRVKVHGWV